ncbi:hypothetical protein SAMN05216389_1115 [Oceanobacillus limi]|uniref:Uncharacterized protein n=1 Tax=Oceanobacillus limi TaxID=930131 RepID=A0A1I0EAG8_9BACI|nr:hypothetical protein [Oceanobacillus limi]SET42051.1 hypothetical protein SAMN05216389_1115 [Oceanobacillus limi]
MNKSKTDEHRYFDGVFSYTDENGEARISAPATTHRVISYEQTEAYKREQAAEKWRRGRQPSFTATRMRNIHEVYDALTTAQCGYLMRLQCSVDYVTGRLVNSDKSAMSYADMRKELGLARKKSTFSEFLSACKRNDIITEKDGEHFVNQRYHFRGAFTDPYVVKAYTTKVKHVYREVKAADIGLMYRMLPYVHYDLNALCDNPYEDDPNKIRWFNRKSLAEAIGVDPATLGRRLPKMKFGDEYVIARIKVGGKEKYTFNPNVFYRKDTKPSDDLIAMFNTKEA